MINFTFYTERQPIFMSSTTDNLDIDADEKDYEAEATSTTKRSTPKEEKRNSRKPEKSHEEHEEQSIANALQDLKFLSEALLNLKDDNI